MSGLSVVQSAGFPASANSTGVFTLATAPAQGDLLIAFIGYNSDENLTGHVAPVPPAGWETLFTTDDSTHYDALGCYYYVAPASAPVSYTFTSPGDYMSGIGLLDITGQASAWLSSYLVSGGAGDGSLSFLSPAVAPSSAGCLAIAAYTEETNTEEYTGVGDGWTQAQSETQNWHGGTSAYMSTLTTTTDPVSCEFFFTQGPMDYTTATIIIAPAALVPVTYNFAVTVSNSATGLSGTGYGTFTVDGGVPNPPALTITSTTAGGGQVGTALSASLTASGGVPPYSWSVVSGSLPPGISMTTAGVLSGTPTTAGSYPFTAQVTDAMGTSLQASYTITISGTPVYTGTYTDGGDSPLYSMNGQDPSFTLPGATGNAYVGANVWGPVSGETGTLTVWSVTNWNWQVSITNPGGSVTCFPNSCAQNGLNPPLNWSSLSYFLSGWDEEMDTETNIIASACYDNWVTSTLVPSKIGFTSPVNEIMWHFDFRNRGAGPWYAENIPFGGYTVNGVEVPASYWSLAYGGTALYFNQTDGNSNMYSTPTGVIDVKAMMTYLVSQGLISAGAPFTAFSLGFEICDTEGTPRNFKYNSMFTQTG